MVGRRICECEVCLTLVSNHQPLSFASLKIKYYGLKPAMYPFLSGLIAISSNSSSNQNAN